MPVSQTVLVWHQFNQFNTHRDHKWKITEKLDEKGAIEDDASDVAVVLQVRMNGGHHQAADGHHGLEQEKIGRERIEREV